MMQYKVINLSLSSLLMLMCFAFAKAIPAQTDSIVAADEQVKNEVLASMRKMDSVKPKQERILIDGVSGVVGDYLILKSDIKKTLDDLKRTQFGANISNCDLIESMLQEKMYAHHAIQDSIVVGDAEINGQVEQRLAYIRQELRSNDDKVLLEFYKKNSLEEIRAELFKLSRDKILSDRMKERLTESVEITPEEVREFFYSLPEDKRPLFNTEVEVSQIIIKPEPTEEAEQEAIDQLNEYRNDVLENGASFAAKAALFSDDSVTEQNGGIISLERNGPFVKEFKDAAFSLQEGEISKPFRTDFGWHILLVDKVRGQVRDVRHILLIPYISVAQVRKAKQELTDIRDKILYKELTFEEAAKKFSEEKETAKNGGKLINPRTGEARFELNKLPEEYTAQVQFLQKGDISGVLDQRDQSGNQYFKIIFVKNKIEDHEADYALDFLKIKELALTNKKIEVIDQWQKEKLKDTYIKLGEDVQGCESLLNWAN